MDATLDRRGGLKGRHDDGDVGGDLAHRSGRSVSADHDEQGPHEDFEVQAHRAVLEVVQVVCELRGEIVAQCAAVRTRGSPVDLPPAGDTRAHRMSEMVNGVVPRYHLWQLWSRANQGHVATEDVDELRQLVDRRPAQQSTELGD